MTVLMAGGVRNTALSLKNSLACLRFILKNFIALLCGKMTENELSRVSALNHVSSVLKTLVTTQSENKLMNSVKDAESYPSFLMREGILRHTNMAVRVPICHTLHMTDLLYYCKALDLAQSASIPMLLM